MAEVRKAGSYEIRSAILVGNKEIVLGENPSDKEGLPYMCAYCDSDGILFRYSEVMSSADYAEIVELFGERIKEQAAVLRAALQKDRADGIEDRLLTEADCTPISSKDDLHNRVVVIKAEILRPEYRTAGHQIKLCTGGFGASPNSRGNACFCKDLRTGNESRFERWEIIGTLEKDQLPEWARTGLAVIENAKADRKAAGKEAR